MISPRDSAKSSTDDGGHVVERAPRAGQEAAPSVDSLLIAYSPPNETIHELASLNLGSYQSHHHHQNHQPPACSYAKVRPEPINERSIVDSVVGFFHDVVGGDTHHSRQHHSHASLGHHHAVNKSSASTNASGSAMSEIKEQIEWIHFESFVNLDAYLNQQQSSSSTSGSSSSTSSTSTSSASSSSASTSIPSNNNSSLLLVIGYKTGFAIWTIDVS